MIRPYGCAPVAPQDWVVLRTYARIVEMREGTRMDDNGVVLCDRDVKRFYQSGGRPAPPPDPGGQAEARGGERDRPSFLDRGAPGTVARVAIIEMSFRSMLDKLWHRYMFPFGTFMYNTPPASAGKTETTYRETLQAGRTDAKHVINPYSVALADILYLCNTAGYLERFAYIMCVILWAKRENCNLLHHRRYHGTEVRRLSRLDQFLTLEKHMHLFGSIWLHIHVMQSNKEQVGGNWNEMVQNLESLGNQLAAEFNVNRDLVGGGVPTAGRTHPAPGGPRQGHDGALHERKPALPPELLPTVRSGVRRKVTYEIQKEHGPGPVPGPDAHRAGPPAHGAPTPLPGEGAVAPQCVAQRWVINVFLVVLTLYLAGRIMAGLASLRPAGGGGTTLDDPTGLFFCQPACKPAPAPPANHPEPVHGRAPGGRKPAPDRVAVPVPVGGHAEYQAAQGAAPLAPESHNQAGTGAGHVQRDAQAGV